MRMICVKKILQIIALKPKIGYLGFKYKILTDTNHDNANWGAIWSVQIKKGHTRSFRNGFRLMRLAERIFSASVGRTDLYAQPVVTTTSTMSRNGKNCNVKHVATRHQ